MDEWLLWLDLKNLARTIPDVLKGRGRLAKYDSTGLGRLESKVFSRLNPENQTGK